MHVLNMHYVLQTQIGGGFFFIIIMLFSYFAIKEKIPQKEILYAYIDNKCELGGILMAEQDLSFSDWDVSTEKQVSPKFLWNSKEKKSLFILSAIYLLLAIASHQN